MFRLVDVGRVAGDRYAQIGLRGYWPGPAEFDWQRSHGIASLFMHDVRELGIRKIVERALEHAGDGPTYLTVDVDVLDPAYAEPGGMTSVDLLWAVREIASRVELVGADVVEVLPQAVGSADITALVAERIVREILTGLALRRSRARTATQ
jgi:arginase family enzyme